VEGFLHWVTATGELGRFSSVQRATKGEGAPQFGHSFSGFCGKAREELAMYTGSIVFHYRLYLLL
jgi:hypothetical protein